MISRDQQNFLKRLLPPNGTVFVYGQDDPHRLKSSVDTVVLTGQLLQSVPDVLVLLKEIAARTNDRTRVVVLWSRFSRSFSARKIRTLLSAGDFEPITAGRTFRLNYVIARARSFVQKPVSVSVIVPARNERGNIEPIVKRIPALGTSTEIVFVEGGSTDGTLDECHRIAKKYPKKNIRVLVQSKKGKGNAVYEGFEAASGDVVVILDSDLAIPPEELTGVLAAHLSGAGEVVIASRMIYSIPTGAMPLLNHLGNLFFAQTYGWLLGQPRTDLFAGTKLFRKSDYLRIAALRPYLGTRDLWGDLDLLLGAAKLGLKIQDVPVHYHPRVYGTSNMNSGVFLRFLLKAYFIALPKLKPGFRLPL